MSEIPQINESIEPIVFRLDRNEWIEAAATEIAFALFEGLASTAPIADIIARHASDWDGTKQSAFRRGAVEMQRASMEVASRVENVLRQMRDECREDELHKAAGHYDAQANCVEMVHDKIHKLNPSDLEGKPT